MKFENDATLLHNISFALETLWLAIFDIQPLWLWPVEAVPGDEKKASSRSLVFLAVKARAGPCVWRIANFHKNQNLEALESLEVLKARCILIQLLTGCHLCSSVWSSVWFTWIHKWPIWYGRGGEAQKRSEQCPSHGRVAVGFGSEGALSNFTSSAASGAASGVKVNLTRKFHSWEKGNMKYKHRTLQRHISNWQGVDIQKRQFLLPAIPPQDLWLLVNCIARQSKVLQVLWSVGDFPSFRTWISEIHPTLNQSHPCRTHILVQGKIRETYMTDCPTLTALLFLPNRCNHGNIRNDAWDALSLVLSHWIYGRRGWYFSLRFIFSHTEDHGKQDSLQRSYRFGHKMRITAIGLATQYFGSTSIIQNWPWTWPIFLCLWKRMELDEPWVMWVDFKVGTCQYLTTRHFATWFPCCSNHCAAF